MPPTDNPSCPQTWPAAGRLAPVSADSATLFVYGSLLFPQVLSVLIDRDPQRAPATAKGWRVVQLAGEVYPGVLTDQDASATGDLLLDLSRDEWVTIDAFENPRYALTRLTVDVGNGHAWAYAGHAPSAAAAGWDREAFATDHLPGYLRSCARWRRQREQSASA